MTTNSDADIGQESEEDFRQTLVEDLEAPVLRLHAGRWPRVALGIASAMALTAAVALSYTGAPVPEPLSPSSVVELAAAVSYTDHGDGKCVLRSGGDPKNIWKASGNIKKMCDERSDCLGYSAASTGSGLLWLSGPLKGGGERWGYCKCFIKNVPADDDETAPTDPPTDAPPPQVKKEWSEHPEKTFLSRYWIRSDQCKAHNTVKDYSECLVKGGQLAPDNLYFNAGKLRGNLEFTRQHGAGCRVNPAHGFWFNHNFSATPYPVENGGRYLCKRTDEEMPDFEAMRKDQDLLIKHCITKGWSFGTFKQCVLEISGDW